MTLQKSTKTILFASLIVAMILPFSGMQFAAAEEQTNKDSSYEEKVKKSKYYQDLDSDGKKVFDNNLKESLENASKYQKRVNKLLDKLAENEFNMESAASNGEDTTKFERMQSAIIFDLEKYGVVSEERLLENPDYWAERVLDAMIQVNKGKIVSTGLEDKTDPSLYRIHTDDVSLKVQSQISYVCALIPPFDIPWYCMDIDVEWGGGSTADSTKWLPYSGWLYTTGKICLEDDGGHNQVFFSFDTNHNTETIWGTTVWEVINTTGNYYLTHEGTCVELTENTNAVAGLWAQTLTHLDTTITVN